MEKKSHTKKVGVVNRTTLLNFGSVLQVLALAKAVERFGYEVDVIWEEGSVSKNIDLRPIKIISIMFKLLRYPQFIVNSFKDLRAVQNIEYGEATKRLFANFVEQNIKRRFFSHSQMSIIGKGEEYYKFICGSDQVWSSTTMYPDPIMYLRFASKEKRIAYAPSLGRSFIPQYNVATLKLYIKDIPYVSIRESEGASLLNKLINREVSVVLDPTLLFGNEFWQKYMSPIKESEYVLCYFLNQPSKKVQENIIRFAKGKKIVILKSPLDYIINTHGDVVAPEAGPGEFLSYIKDADFVFTDSYHGMIFSINFEKEFLSVEREYGKFDQSTRQKSILNQLGINGHYNSTGSSPKSTIDYDKVIQKLNELRNYSFNYLKSALNNE